MREDGVIVSLYEPNPDRAHGGLLGAVAAFLAGEDSEGAQAVEQLDISREEASSLQRSIVLYRCERFLEAALSCSLQPTGGSSDGCLSIETLFDMLYDAWSAEHGRVDLAERMGAAAVAAECVDGQPLSELLRRSVLCDAADDILQFASNHHRMRHMLIETLVRHNRPSLEGGKQMWALLKFSCFGSDGHFNSVAWFLGQLEHYLDGRLWAPRVGAGPHFVLKRGRFLSFISSIFLLK
jgi:hypothetical protein